MPVETLIERNKTVPKITIYTTPTCSFCRMAKNFFREHDLSYEEKDVTRNHDFVEEMVNKSGQMGVPVIDIDEDIVVGFDKRRIAQLVGVR